MFGWSSRRQPRAASTHTATNAYTRINSNNDNQSMDNATIHETDHVGMRTRLRRLFSGVGRDWIAFFIFDSSPNAPFYFSLNRLSGCINNVIYVVILSAAVDLVGATVPKGVVLLADIAPSLLIKSIAPYFVHKFPYSARVVMCASLSFSAVVLIARANSITIRLLGIMMASLSSGLGELTFLMLSSFYRLQMVSAWSSGTGGAGLLGAFLFLALTSWIGLSIPWTLAVVSTFPIMMLIAYFFILTNPPNPSSRHQAAGYRPISSFIPRATDGVDDDRHAFASSDYPQEHLNRPSSPSSLHSMSDTSPLHTEGQQDRNRSETDNSRAASSTLHASSGQTTPPSVSRISDNNSASSLSINPVPHMIPSWEMTVPSWEHTQQRTEPTSINTLLAVTDPDDPNFVSPFRESEVGSTNATGRRRRVYKSHPNEDMTMQEKRAMARSLLVPFMFPLFLVYFAEYTMNQGVLPVVLFPLKDTPFTHMRDHYVTYSAIYQLGVFISRSSASIIDIPRLWIPSILQVFTLLLATSQALLTAVASSPSSASSAWWEVLASLPMPLPSIYLVFALIFWEGLLGGATYVHTYIGISKDLDNDPRGKEFALGVVGVADGLGILLAGVVSLWLEPALCRWQVAERGVELCLSMAD
ncbi:battenin CLN3 protein [Linnemannia zychae]|nr:battenin CLN3 protein [Linnemannia zychae]